MSQQLLIEITSENAPNEEIVQYARELHQSIRAATKECDVKIPQQPARPGEKGVMEILGALNVAFEKLDILNVIAQVVNTYITQRRKTVCVKVLNSTGDCVEISAENLKTTDLKDLAKELKKLVDNVQNKSRDIA